MAPPGGRGLRSLPPETIMSLPSGPSRCLLFSCVRAPRPTSASSGRELKDKFPGEVRSHPQRRPARELRFQFLQNRDGRDQIAEYAKNP